MPSLNNLRNFGCVVLMLLNVSVAAAQPPAANFSSDLQSGCAPLVVHFQDKSSNNPAQWSWDLGNGTISHQQHPSGTYFNPGTYQVKLVVKNSSGSDSIIRSQFITVYANPTPKFSLSDSTGCYPKTIQFTDKSDPGFGTIAQWSWDFGDGTISNQQNPVHTYTKPGSYHVTLKVINSQGCQKTITRQNLVQLQSITAAFNFATGNGCSASNQVNFSSLTQGAASHSWDFGDGTRAGVTNPSHQYTIPGTYPVKLVVVNNTGCKDSVTRNVTVGFIKADFSFGPACAGSPVSFQNNSSPSPVQVKWLFGDGSSSTELYPAKTFSAPGVYLVKLISDFGGCVDTVVKTVTVTPKPSAAFTQSGNLSHCSGPLTINFAANAPGMNYHWSFGDGAGSSSRNPSHTYSKAGIYDVTLVVTNASGCSDTIVKRALVKIVPPRITGVSGISYRGCTPYTANFSANVESGDPVVGWRWSFGDGSSSTAANPVHQYNNPGMYTVRLVVTTAGGCKDSVEYPATIQISDKPVAAFTAAPVTVCAAGQVQFTNTSTGAEEWFWDFGDGGFSTEKNPAHQFGDTGLFTIKLIASSTGCTDTLVKKDYIRNDPPIGRFNVVRDCAKPYEIGFRDSSIGGQRYKWYFGDGDSSDLRFPKHTYKVTGTYQVQFIVYHGSCSYTSNASVRIIDERPTLSAADTIVCRNAPVSFKAGNVNAGNIASYHWNFGDGSTAVTGGDEVSHAYSKPGLYTVQLITIDAVGCADTTNPISIRVHGATAAFTIPEGACVGSTVVFKDSSVTDGSHPITRWNWSFGDGNAQGYSVAPFTHNYNNAGSYQVQLKITDSYGCVDSVTAPTPIVITDPVASFALTDSVKCADNDVSFTNKSAGLNLKYSWQFGDGNNSVDENPAHSYQQQGLYTVKLQVTDRFGCQDMVQLTQAVSNPKAAFLASDTFSSCPPLLVNLTNLSKAATTAAWDFGDGGTADLANPSHYYTYPGSYRLKLTVQGYGNCVDSAFKTVVIKGPTGSFRFNPDTICTNGVVSFHASSKDNSKYFWDFTDGITRTTTDSAVTHSFETPGFYQPRLILIDTAGCEVAISSPDTIKVLGVQAKIAFNNALFCDSVSLQFRDSSIAHNDLPSQYQWSFGDGSFSSSSNPIHRYNRTGSYQVKLKVTTQAGCTDSVTAPVPVVIHSSPQVSIKSRMSVCLNDSVNFEGIEVAPHTSTMRWIWNFSNGRSAAVQNPSQSYGSEGSYPVKLVATNESGCSDTATTTILVHPLPNLNAGTDTMICRGQTYTLQPSGAASYQWRNDPMISCIDCPAPKITPEKAGIFFVKGISEFGCVAVDSVTISVLQPFTIKTNHDDSLCAGDKIQLVANGAAKYRWYPSTGLSDNTIANPVATPGASTRYMVVGTDQLGCFTDTGVVNISVFPVPQFNIIDKMIVAPAGSTATIKTSNSADVKNWKWYPSTGLSCADCPEPVLTAKDDIVYRAEVWNEGGCAASDKVTVSVICDNGNVFIPNTFSPNNDGMNDVFYPRGKGITSVKRMKIFNRWGELVYEKNDFSANDATAAWNGNYKGLQLTPDVYVYIVDVVCDNSTVFTLKGNVTLIR